MSLEETVIRLCAPVIVGIKPANLFSVKTAKYPKLEDELRDINAVLQNNGLQLRQVVRCKHYSLVYVYRVDLLEKCIFDTRVANFLKHQGYNMNVGLESVLEVLFTKLTCKMNFPHEIGFFLGYPLEDIEGFVKHQGKNCKMFGYWKVYGDEHRAKKLFSEYDQCKERLVSLYRTGTSFNQLCAAS